MGAGGADSALRFAGRTSSDPARAVSRWKALSGGKAAGCLPFFVPEEILHAAGILPVTVFGDEYEGEAASRSWELLDGWVLPPVQGLSPESENFLTEAVPALPQVSLCFSARRMKVPSTEETLDRVELLREWAGGISGRPVTDGALGKSIRVFNENRRLYFELGARLSSDPGVYSAREVCWMIRSAMALPREAHTELLHAVLSRRPAPGRGSGVRVFLGGRIATMAAAEAVDAAGAAMVGEALAAGSRAPEPMVDEEGDPALALARRLRTQMLGWVGPEAEPSWAARHLDRVEASGADRFLYLGAGADLPDLSGILSAEAGKRGMPFLCAERDPSPRSAGRHDGRIARFLATGGDH